MINSSNAKSSDLLILTLLTCGGPGLRKQDIQDEAFDLCDCPCWVLVASQRGVGTTCVLVKQAAASAAAATALAAALGMMLAAVAVAAAAAMMAIA